MTRASPSHHRSSVVSANNVDVKRFKVGTADYGVEISNKMPTLDWPATDGIRAFFSAVAGRSGYYRKSRALGVFNDAKQVADRYPGIKVTTGSLL